jgi:hypothetical protein
MAISTRVKPCVRGGHGLQGMHRATSVAPRVAAGEGEGDALGQPAEVAGGEGGQGGGFEVVGGGLAVGRGDARWLPLRSPPKMRAPRQRPPLPARQSVPSAAGVAHHLGPVGGGVAQLGVAAGAAQAVEGRQAAELDGAVGFGGDHGGERAFGEAGGGGLEQALEVGAVAARRLSWRWMSPVVIVATRSLLARCPGGRR